MEDRDYGVVPAHYPLRGSINMPFMQSLKSVSDVSKMPLTFLNGPSESFYLGFI